MFLMFPFIIITLLIKINSKGPAIIWSRRIGYLNKEFKMPKFRTMKIETPQLASHLLDNPDNYITSFGLFLRRFSLDELPQLYSIITGEMNIVGPRPALYNQYDLIKLRNQNGIDKIKPGITGWAQINGRDEILIADKVNLDKYYLENRSMRMDVHIILMTLMNTLSKKDVSH